MIMNSFLHLYLVFAVLFSIKWKITFQISCKDEKNRDVDWFILYKFPTIKAEKKGSDLHAGKAYAYITSRDVENKGDQLWTLSSRSIASKGSLLGKTWKEYRKTAKKEDWNVAFLFYNDAPPSRRNGKSVGHLKGYVAFDAESGIWLTHSIPKFGNAEKYKFPKSARKNGQIALCVTFDIEALNEICKHLLYCHPNIYDASISSELLEGLDKRARTLFTEKPGWIKKGPLKKITELKSKEDVEFLAFAKDNQLKVDIYSEIIAPYLHTDLLVQSWRLGRSKVQPPSQQSHIIRDISALNMTFKDGKKSVSFKSKQDHSKWTITTNNPSTWICIGDLNRMKSQNKRGGGAVCFLLKPVWKAFSSIIQKAVKSPKKKIFSWQPELQ